MIPFKINEYLVVNDFGNTARIVFVVIRNQTNIALPEIGKFIINQKDESFIQGVIEKMFRSFQFFGNILICVGRKFLPELIKVNIEPVEPVIVPEKLVELNPAFPKGHLMAIIKLSICLIIKNQDAASKE
jgi:hypothetical protein